MQKHLKNISCSECMELAVLEYIYSYLNRVNARVSLSVMCEITMLLGNDRILWRCFELSCYVPLGLVCWAKRWLLLSRMPVSNITLQGLDLMWHWVDTDMKTVQTLTTTLVLRLDNSRKRDSVNWNKTKLVTDDIYHSHYKNTSTRVNSVGDVAQG